MKKLLLAGAALAALNLPSFAADLPVAPVLAPPAPAWAGWYVGANVGGVWGETHPGFAINDSVGRYYTFGAGQAQNVATVTSAGNQRFDTDGWTAGVQLGYNWQYSAIVFGVEADINYYAPDGTLAVAGFLPAPGGQAFFITSSSESDWLATLRARVGGLITPNLLIYGTVGVAAANSKFTATYRDTTTAPPQVSATLVSNYSKSGTAFGTVLGGGFEWMFAPRWSLKAEYLWTQIDSVDGGTIANATTGSPTAFYSVFNYRPTLNENIVRAGVNYHF